MWFKSYIRMVLFSTIRLFVKVHFKYLITQSESSYYPKYLIFDKKFSKDYKKKRKKSPISCPYLTHDLLRWPASETVPTKWKNLIAKPIRENEQKRSSKNVFSNSGPKQISKTVFAQLNVSFQFVWKYILLLSLLGRASKNFRSPIWTPSW